MFQRASDASEGGGAYEDPQVLAVGVNLELHEGIAVCAAEGDEVHAAPTAPTDFTATARTAGTSAAPAFHSVRFRSLV